MKFNISAKETELYSQMIEDLCDQLGFDKFKLDDLSDKDRETFEQEKEKIEAVVKKYFRWGEYVDMEVDTDTCTCTIVSYKAS